MAKRQKSAVEMRVARVMDYKRTFGSEQGKRVMQDLMSAHFMMRPTFDRKLSENEHFFREGQRAVVLRILTALEMSEEELHSLIKESNNAANDPAYTREQL